MALYRVRFPKVLYFFKKFLKLTKQKHFVKLLKTIGRHNTAIR